MSNAHQRLVSIADALANAGWYVGESIFDATLTRALLARARTLTEAGRLHAAKVGRTTLARRSDAVRTDETRWLDDAPTDVAECAALEQVHALRAVLNETLFVGAQDAELHFARYAPGAFYKTHLDRFRDDDVRVVSMVFFLNEAWPQDAGGELVLYASDASDGSGAEQARVIPSAGTMACFLSDRFPHEVLPGARERFSLTGWMRRAPQRP